MCVHNSECVWDFSFLELVSELHLEICRCSLMFLKPLSILVYSVVLLMLILNKQSPDL